MGITGDLTEVTKDEMSRGSDRISWDLMGISGHLMVIQWDLRVIL
jgi:hypothetical protein